MENYDVICPQGHKLRVTEAHFGKTVQCPKCTTTFMVPTPGATPGAAPGMAPEEAAAPAPPAVFNRAPQPDPRRDSAPTAGARATSPLMMVLGPKVAVPMLLAGLVMVLLARGCDSIGNHGVGKAHANLGLAKNEFNDTWKAKLKDKEGKSRSDLIDEKNKEEKKLEEGDWQSLENTARDAELSNQVNRYYREWLFLLGTITLTLGLIGTAFAGQGAERWVCLVMLAIIAFSIYIGGAAWIFSFLPMH